MIITYGILLPEHMRILQIRKPSMHRELFVKLFVYSFVFFPSKLGSKVKKDPKTY